MSYRELRNFCEIMRGLGYPRLISIENFRKPNFELVADILYWLAQRFDPTAEITDDIEEEKHRVEFIRQVATLFRTKTRIKLNTKKLYGSDGYAVQEILKVASVLYKAYNSTPSDEDISQGGFQLPSKLSNLKGHKAVATEITEIGARLFDSLGKEKELKQHREKALQFLDNISSNLESNNEQQYVEKCVREIITQQDTSIDEMQRYVTNLERDQRTLEEKMKKRNLELDKSQKRLQLMTGMRPTYLDEYERLEVELEKMYDIYIERFRNLNYLENQLNQYNKIEQKRFNDNQDKIKRLGEQITAEEIRELEGKDDIDQSRLDKQLEDIENNRGQSRGDSRALASRGPDLGEEDEEDGQSSLEDGDEGQDLEDSGEEGGSQSDDF